jgi:hypothetical protein
MANQDFSVEQRRQSGNGATRNMGANRNRNQQQQQSQTQRQTRGTEHRSTIQSFATGGLKHLALKIWEDCRPGVERARHEAVVGIERGFSEIRQGAERAWNELVQACEGAKSRFFSSNSQSAGSSQKTGSMAQ